MADKFYPSLDGTVQRPWWNGPNSFVANNTSVYQNYGFTIYNTMEPPPNYTAGDQPVSNGVNLLLRGGTSGPGGNPGNAFLQGGEPGVAGDYQAGHAYVIGGSSALNAVYPGEARIYGGVTQRQGADVRVRGGNANVNGPGGDVLLFGGTGINGWHNGYVKMPGLPVADPHVADALWNNSGVLTVSAG